MLVVARFVQGVGGAMTAAVVLGMIVTMFPEPREQAKAIGVYAFVASAGGSVGLLAGGVLTQALSWHWIFFINIPIGVLTGLLSLRLLDRDRGLGFGKRRRRARRRADHAALMLGVYTIVEPAAEDGWGAGRTLGLRRASLVLLGRLHRPRGDDRQPARAAADLPLAQRLGRERDPGADGRRHVRPCSSSAPCTSGGAGLRRARDGLAFLPTTLVMGTLSVRYSERLIMRFGRATTLLPGLVLIAPGCRCSRRRRSTAPTSPTCCRRCCCSASGVGAGVPGADDARDVGRDAGGRGPGLGPGQHDRAGRRGARARRPGDALGDPHRGPAGRRATRPRSR